MQIAANRVTPAMRVAAQLGDMSRLLAPHAETASADSIAHVRDAVCPQTHKACDTCLIVRFMLMVAASATPARYARTWARVGAADEPYTAALRGEMHAMVLADKPQPAPFRVKDAAVVSQSALMTDWLAAEARVDQILEEATDMCAHTLWMDFSENRAFALQFILKDLCALEQAVKHRAPFQSRLAPHVDNTYGMPLYLHAVAPRARRARTDSDESSDDESQSSTSSDDESKSSASADTAAVAAADAIVRKRPRLAIPLSACIEIFDDTAHERLTVMLGWFDDLRRSVIPDDTYPQLSTTELPVVYGPQRHAKLFKCLRRRHRGARAPAPLPSPEPVPTGRLCFLCVSPFTGLGLRDNVGRWAHEQCVDWWAHAVLG